MKALSIKQPWAWLICAGYKDIENRNWKIGRKSQHGPYSSYHQANFTIELPCRIFVHAGKTFDRDGDDWLTANIRMRFPTLYQNKTDLDVFCGLYFSGAQGAIIGEVDIIDCVRESTSPWFVGPYGFVLANPKAYEKPIPCRGMLGFFEPGIEGKQ